MTGGETPQFPTPEATDAVRTDEALQRDGGAVVELTGTEAAVDYSQLPGRSHALNERWAIEGEHRSWLGFDSQTGQPKVG